MLPICLISYIPGQKLRAPLTSSVCEVTPIHTDSKFDLQLSTVLSYKSQISEQFSYEYFQNFMKFLGLIILQISSVLYHLHIYQTELDSNSFTSM